MGKIYKFSIFTGDIFLFWCIGTAFNNVNNSSICVLQTLLRCFVRFDTFSPPEPTILLICTRDRDLWQGPKQQVRESRTSGFCAQPQKFETITVTIGYKNGQVLRLRVTWPLPEVSIPGADQKDHGLWGREWVRHRKVFYTRGILREGGFPGRFRPFPFSQYTNFYQNGTLFIYLKQNCTAFLKPKQ